MNLKKIFDSLNDGYVDLGLTSGTLWSDRNVGANTPEGNGDYFTFEEAQELGNVPTKEQLRELNDECEWNWKEEGFEVVGPNGNSIFLPAAGYRSGTDIVDVGSDGFYWSSTTYSYSLAYYLGFYRYYAGIDYSSHNFAQSVRLVK